MKTVPCHCVCKWRVLTNPVTYRCMHVETNTYNYIYVHTYIHSHVCMSLHHLCMYLKSSYLYICITDIPLSCFFPLPLALSDGSAKVITFKKAIVWRIHILYIYYYKNSYQLLNYLRFYLQNHILMYKLTHTNVCTHIHTFACINVWVYIIPIIYH